MNNDYYSRRRKILLDIAKYVLSEISPRAIFEHALAPIDIRPFQKIAVFSIGKAAREMSRAVCKKLSRKPDTILLADRGHPFPTREGIEKTKRIISAAQSLGEKDLAIVCISGGGSSMLVAPVQSISLNEKINITKALLKSGAPIQEINVVRKHISQVKGGRLASLLYPATVYGFILSDVAGNDLGTIASGPLSPDKSTFSDALQILEKYRIHAPPRVIEYFKKGENNRQLETPKAGEKYFKKVFVSILADHRTVAQKAYKHAKKMGLRTIILNKPITGEARQSVKSFIAHAKRNSLIIGFGETTVTVRGKGSGGRNQEFVLSGLRYLKENQTLLSIGTDGVDGICPELIAGAIADTETIRNAKKLNLSTSFFIQNNDSYAFFKKTGGHIKTGKTGTNLGDLMLLLTN